MGVHDESRSMRPIRTFKYSRTAVSSEENFFQTSKKKRRRRRVPASKKKAVNNVRMLFLHI